MRKSNIKKPNIPLQLASVLLMLVLFTACLIPGLYARYTTSSQGSDGARVARFEVEITSTDENISINDDGTNGTTVTETYEFTVTNKSEVSLNYDIQVVLSAALPNGISLKIGDDIGTTEDNKIFVFDGGRFNAGDGLSQSYTLTITAFLGATDSSLKEDYENQTVKINVIAEQID